MSTPEKPVVEPQRPLSWAEATRRAIRDGLYAARTASVTGLDGASLIAAERRRQITVERYDAAHDSGHADELALAGAVYATPARKRRVADRMASDISERASIYRVPEEWPWHPGYYKPVPGDRIRELVKAGALIAAAIDAEQGSAPSIEQEPGETLRAADLRRALRANRHAPDIARDPMANQWNRGIDRALEIVDRLALEADRNPQETER